MVLERALYKCICNLPSHNGFSKHTYCHWTPFYKNLTELSLSRCIVDASNETKSAHALAALKHFNVTCIQLLFMKSCVAPIPYTTIALFEINNKMTSDHRQNISRLALMLSSKPGSVLDVDPKLKKVCPVSELQKTQTILL